MSRRVRNASRVVRGTVVLSLTVLLFGDRGGAPARADNAFPASQSVLVPRDRPQELVVGTTFGLVFTEDDGATWTYVCESLQATLAGRQYRMGPPPNRLFAVSDLGAPVSDDGGCTWSLPTGPLASLLVLDVWPDPSLPERAFVLALDPRDQAVSAFRSSDGGRSYQGPIFVAPPDVTITGIESAASNPDVVYMTAQNRADAHPWLLRSDDAGDTWITTDIEPGVGTVVPRLVAVDPVDPNQVVLLLLGNTADTKEFQALAMTADAGASWWTPLMVPEGTLSGFTRLPDGTLLAIGSVPRTGDPPDAGAGLPATVETVFRSEDAGKTFVSQAVSFHAVGLAQRDSIVYAATDDFRDGFALAKSIDGGRRWSPQLRFRDIKEVKACVRAACQQDCDYQAGIKLFPPETCNPPGPDAAIDRPQTARGGGGCGCAASGSRAAAGTSSLAVGAVLVSLRFRRRSVALRNSRRAVQDRR